MIQVEKISIPNFTHQQDNKVIHSHHQDDISVSYESTYTLKYVLEGYKYYNFGEGDLKVSSNQYLFVNDQRKITTEAKKGAKGLSFFIERQLIEDVYGYTFGVKNTPCNFFEYPQYQSGNALSSWLSRNTPLFINNSYTSPLLEELLFIELAELIITEHYHTLDILNLAGIVRFNTQQEVLKTITRTKEYIHDNLSNQINLENLSKAMGVSKYYLHRLFKELTGTTPVEYITQTRITEAKRLLRDTKKSILDISIQCGFESQSYFSRIFKGVTGLTPSTHRSLS